ncbi:hypothetical protein EV421DRAFT_2024757 [Armillaria borealis]|uniref:Uncharacterized protein n=1 Tax=Armillaria borealis TaxID=47425 RepID=A0AA39ME87_9AGAR|nr:hypothetical protein EV421DRAFT_2024757 [Armillaria borealis]
MAVMDAYQLRPRVNNARTRKQWKGSLRRTYQERFIQNELPCRKRGRRILKSHADELNLIVHENTSGEYEGIRQKHPAAIRDSVLIIGRREVSKSKTTESGSDLRLDEKINQLRGTGEGGDGRGSQSSISSVTRRTLVLGILFWGTLSLSGIRTPPIHVPRAVPRMPLSDTVSSVHVLPFIRFKTTLIPAALNTNPWTNSSTQRIWLVASGTLSIAGKLLLCIPSGGSDDTSAYDDPGGFACTERGSVQARLLPPVITSRLKLGGSSVIIDHRSTWARRILRYPHAWDALCCVLAPAFAFAFAFIRMRFHK